MPIVDDFADARAACRVAAASVVAGDFTGAISQYMAAQLLLTGVPDSSNNAGARLAFHREIGGMIAALRERESRAATAAATSGGGAFQQSKLEYVRPGCEDE